MKKSFLVFMLTLLSNLGITYANGDMHMHDKANHSGHHGKDVPDVVVEGKLIGLTCFIKHGAIGEKHKDCFKECAEKGLPIGILTKENKIYQVSGEGHDDLKNTNVKFLKYAEEQVVAKGKVFSNNGINMLVIKGIKKAN